MGNLYYDGIQDRPFPSFRTDNWELPINHDPAARALDRNQEKERKMDAEERLKERVTKETDLAKEIIQRLETLSEPLGLKE